jgi:hypothetical protein
MSSSLNKKLSLCDFFSLTAAKGMLVQARRTDG